jgi:hypothetical protein
MVFVDWEDVAMRFKPKVNYVSLACWLVFMTIVGANGIYTLNPKVHSIYFGLGVLSWLLFLTIILILRFIIFPEFYDLQEVGLFLRQGRKRNLIPYASIDKVLPLDPAAGILYPANCFAYRFLVLPEKSSTIFTIAVSERERFLAEVSKRCPQLETRETKDGLSLQRAIL